MDEGAEVTCAPIVSCCDASEVFEFVDASLDAVAQLVEGEVVGDEPFPGGIAGNDGLGTLTMSSRRALLSYALSAMTWLGWKPSRRAGACGASPHWPGVRMTRTGRPRLSTARWILVVNPPRDRPRAWFWSPLFRSPPADELAPGCYRASDSRCPALRSGWRTPSPTPPPRPSG